MKTTFFNSFLKIAPLVVVGLITAACGETERTDAQAKENISKYTPKQKELMGSFLAFITPGDVLKLCVEVNAVNSDMLDRYEANKKILLKKLNDEDTESGEVFLDVQAVSKAITRQKAGQLTTNDCNQAINFLMPLGFFSDH